MLGDGLVVDSSFGSRNEFGADSSELVAELDGLLEGYGEQEEFPDDYKVHGGAVQGGVGDHSGELVPVTGCVLERVCDGEAPGLAVVAAGCLLVLRGDDCAAWRQGVPDVDRGCWHWVGVPGMDGG